MGAIFVTFGLLHLGFVSQFIATSVQVGMMFGLGLTIIATQIPKLLGIPGSEGTFVDQVVNIIPHLSGTNWITLALGVVSLAALILFKRIAPRFPAALVVVVGSILIVSLLNLPEQGVDVIGAVSTSLPLPAIPHAGLSSIPTLLGGALIISLIGYAESDTVAEEFANKHRYEIRPDQELIALGASNIAAGLFQGFIAGGGASQTAANESAGAKSQMSGLIVSVLILLTAVALMPLFKNLAQAVLGAIVISAVIGFINVPAMRHIRQLRRDSFILALIALFGVLILGVLPGLILAMVISALLILVNAAKPDVVQLGRKAGHEDYVSLERFPDASSLPGLLIIRPGALLFAFNAKHIREELMDQVRASSPGLQVVVLDLEMNTDLDVEGVDTLAELRRDLSLDGIEFWLASPRGHSVEMLERSGLLDQIGKDHIYWSVPEAADAFAARQNPSATEMS
ncbi:MAG: SulP family inorganic anion transporter [Chloroflexota bacterium]